MKEKHRDILIQISLLCRETEITTFVNSLDDLNELFTKVSPMLDKFFSQAYCDSRHCEEIDTLEWNSNDSQVVIRHN